MMNCSFLKRVSRSAFLRGGVVSHHKFAYLVFDWRRLSVELGADWYGLAFGLRVSCWAVRVDFLVFNFEVSLASQDES